MVESSPGAVNRASSSGSTIPRDGSAEPPAPASAVAAWLRARSRQLPLWHGLSMRLMPPRCLFCGQAADLGALDLCSDCLEVLPWSGMFPVPSVDRFSNDPMIDESSEIVVENTLVPFCYADPVDSALRALKFHGDLAPAQVFGALLAAAAARSGDLPDLVVPVPLHADRLHERGFNQAARIASATARWLGRPCALRVLERRCATLPQTSLDAPERRANVRGAFARAGGPARRRLAVVRHVALVDDVLTTGATMAAAAEALRGIGRVSRWAVARPSSTFLTPGPAPG